MTRVNTIFSVYVLAMLFLLVGAKASSAQATVDRVALDETNVAGERWQRQLQRRQGRRYSVIGRNASVCRVMRNLDYNYRCVAAVAVRFRGNDLRECRRRLFVQVGLLNDENGNLTILSAIYEWTDPLRRPSRSWCRKIPPVAANLSQSGEAYMKMAGEAREWCYRSRMYGCKPSYPGTPGDFHASYWLSSSEILGRPAHRFVLHISGVMEVRGEDRRGRCRTVPMRWHQHRYAWIAEGGGWPVHLGEPLPGRPFPQGEGGEDAFKANVNQIPIPHRERDRAPRFRRHRRCS